VLPRAAFLPVISSILAILYYFNYNMNMERKSKIVKKNDIDYSKVIVLHGINIDPKQFELEKNKFKQQYAADLQSGKLDELKVNQIIHNMFVQRAAVGQVVTDLQNNFDVNFDETEFAELKENLIQNNPEMVNAVESGKAPKDLIEQFAKRIIYETLL
jgi:vancomycin resistance protein YoaR